MSWDVVLFSSTEKIDSVETINEAALKPADFSKKLKSYFRDIEEEDNFRVISIGDSTIEYEFEAAPSNDFVLSLDSEPALFALAEFAKQHKYQIYDVSLDSMLNLDKPHINGYKDYLAEVRKDLQKK